MTTRKLKGRAKARARTTRTKDPTFLSGMSDVQYSIEEIIPQLIGSVLCIEDADEGRERLAQARGVHDYAWHYATYLTHRKPLTEDEKAQAPPVSHPAIRTHPVSGRRAVYVSEGLTRTIEGMDEAAGRALVLEASAFATQPQFVYSHRWRPRDLVFWDNRSTMHRATEFDDRHRRLMRRTTVEGDEPF